MLGSLLNIINITHNDEHCYPPSNHGIPSFSFPLTIKEWKLYNWSWLAIGICTFFALIISVSHILSHFRHYHKPNLQRYIARILFIIPIYAIDSFFSYKLYWLSVFINVIRDCYEGFIIYNFFCLLLQMLGGYQSAKIVFSNKAVVSLPFPLCFFFYTTIKNHLAHIETAGTTVRLYQAIICCNCLCFTCFGVVLPWEYESISWLCLRFSFKFCLCYFSHVFPHYVLRCYL